MKKLLVLFISIIVPTIISAQSFDTSTDFKKAQELLSKGLITYADIPKDYLTRYINWLQMYRWSRDGGKTYKDFDEFFSNVWNTPEFGGGPNIEIEDNNNIYTYPVAYTNTAYIHHDRGGVRETKWRSYDLPTSVTFYSTKITPEENAGSDVSIHGSHYPAVAAYMNKVKIGKRTEDLWTCFGDINTTNAQIMTPVHNIQMYDNWVVALKVTYSDTPEIIYTPPRYEIIAGQLMELDNGVHYNVPLYDVGYLSLVNPTEMRSKTFAIKGISYPGLKYSEQHLIYYDSNSYSQKRYALHPDETISMNGTPIYFIKIGPNVDGIEFQITPADGDVILDIQETSKYILLCGTNKKQGYVGYDNPTLIIIDKDTKKEIARYRSKRKDKYFTKMFTLDENNLYIRFNDFAYTAFNDGRGPERFEIVNIPSILQQE